MSISRWLTKSTLISRFKHRHFAVQQHKSDESPSVTQYREGCHHAIFDPLDRGTRSACAFGRDRGADGRHAAREPADRGLGGKCSGKNGRGNGDRDQRGTVEQRITALHAALKITPDQEAKWNGVAQSMRENAKVMDSLVASNRTTPPQNLSAVDDLKTYQKFAQAHADGLKNLISSFSTLYDSMPDPQKKIADTVFDNSERGADTTAPAKKS
jgi:hypothetical protein